MTSIKDAEKLIQAFFDAETNNDLYQKPDRGASGI